MINTVFYKLLSVLKRKLRICTSAVSFKQWRFAYKRAKCIAMHGIRLHMRRRKNIRFQRGEIFVY